MLDNPANPPDSNDLLTQLVTGPALREVAATVLRPTLATLYSHLELDPELAMVGTPSWRVVNNQIVAGNIRFESLTDALVRHAITATPVMYIDGEHFLTQQPAATPSTQLPVNIDAIGRLINELAPMLFTAYQEQQLDYWNQTDQTSTPRWQDLSRSLRAIWNIAQVKDWDADQHALARQVFTYPDRVTRTPHDRYQTRACLIDLDLQNGKTSTHLNVLETAVVIGTLGPRTIILTHSIVAGFHAFDSLEQLGAYLGTETTGTPSGGELQWRLFEPDGDFFDTQACTLIALQAEAIGALNFSGPAPAPVLHGTGHGAPHKDSPSQLNSPSRYNRIEQLLPDWLSQASPADLSAYSRHLMDLAAVRQNNKGTSFAHDIPSIDTFALDAMTLLMQKQHSDAINLKLQDLRISITSPVVWGTFATGASETLTLSLVELALENLIAVPLGVKIPYFTSGDAVPDWMTPAYLEELITTVNVGKTYPARIKNRLIDDPVKSVHLRTLYTRHLQVQLPLLALQCKIRGEGAIDELGYRYIVAVMDASTGNHQVDGQEIVIRPLAFVRDDRADDSADTVTNMFVIGPRNPNQGPCLLYRPLLDNPLTQYPTQASLIYAIKHSKRIRQSVLAWLPDKVRADYSNYIFHGDLPGLSVLSELLSNPLRNLNLNGPVALGSQVIDGDYLPALFKANADALIELADRQSVSNAESHWATLKQGAWKLFNAALPFLGPNLGTAAWIWQILDDLQQALDAKEDDDSDLATSALTDLFLTLGMVLAHRAAIRGKPARPFSEKYAGTAVGETEEPVLPGKVSVIQLPDISPSELPTGHQSSIHTSGALNRTPVTLGETLQSFVLSTPDELGQPVSEPGPQQHLYTLGQKLYARVGARWFEVKINDQQDVQIIDSRQQPTRSGPLLIHNKQGRWFIDTRLRLRGGGLKSRKAEVLRQNKQRVVELKQKIDAFYVEVESERQKLSALYNAKHLASADTVNVTTALFLEKLDENIKTYETTIEDLKALNLIEAVPSYRPSMIELLRAQLFFNQSWIDDIDPKFTSTLRVTLELLDKEEQSIEPRDRATYKEMLELTSVMIQRIEAAQSRFLELRVLGKEAAWVAHEFKEKLPVFDLMEMKSLQVTLGQAFCVKEGTTDLLNDARERVERIVDDADLAIQSSMDLQHDENLLNDAERIDALNTLVDQFTSIDLRLQDLPQQFPEELLQEQLDLLQGRISEFSQQSTRQLTQLLLERKVLEPQPGPSRTHQKKVIKTRFKGTQFTVPRKASEGHEQLSDVKASVTGKVLATFHEKTPDTWVQRLPAKSVKIPQIQSLSSALRSGQTLLDGLGSFIEKQKKLANDPNRLPVDIEESLTLHAMKLRDAANALEQALSTGPSSQTQASDAALLKQQLEAAVTRLTEEGHRTRIAMTKQQLPTAPRVEWLNSQQEVAVVMAAGRRRLKGPKKDYLQEYEIRDRKTRKVLWYAHFHYEQLDTAKELYTAAHLKTKEQRLLGSAYNLQTAASNPEVIAIYRSEIGPQLAKTLFFPVAAQPPSAT